MSTVEAEVPLAEMFGYATTIRLSHQGKAEFTMEFSRYAPVPQNIGETLITRPKPKTRRRRSNRRRRPHATQGNQRTEPPANFEPRRF